jgi:hypothetical protein
MSTQKPFTYQPEDLERLLRTKEFNGLLPEERDFVLQHVSNEKEFNELKMLLGNIESSEHEMQDPPAAVWKNLKKEFNAQKPSRFKVWLNFLFPPLPKWSGFRTVSFSLVGMAAVVGAVVWFVPSEKKSDQFASVQDNSKNNENQNSILDTVSKNSEFKVNPEQYAELKPVSGIYETPVVREVEHVQEYPLDEVIQMNDEEVPMNKITEEKNSNRMMDSESENVKVTSNDAPAATFSTGPTITSTSTQLNNVASPQWTTGGSVPTTTIVADSIKVQPKKKKKTPPKKK